MFQASRPPLSRSHVPLALLAALLAVTPLAAQAEAGGRSASSTMAVSLTVVEGDAAPRFEGERFVTGRGAPPYSCETADTCAEPPLPRLKMGGVANTGFRVISVRALPPEPPQAEAGR